MTNPVVFCSDCGSDISPSVCTIDVETSLDSLYSDLKLVLMTGMEYTEPGSVISNCILLIGSAEGDCGKCTKPCLHPLATADLESFFHVGDVRDTHSSRTQISSRSIGLMTLLALSFAKIPPQRVPSSRSSSPRSCSPLGWGSWEVAKKADSSGTVQTRGWSKCTTTIVTGRKESRSMCLREYACRPISNDSRVSFILSRYS